jgi:hypothetical protein
MNNTHTNNLRSSRDACRSGLLVRAFIYVLPVPVLILVDPTVLPACLLVATAAFYWQSYRAGARFASFSRTLPVTCCCTRTQHARNATGGL